MGGVEYFVELRFISNVMVMSVQKENWVFFSKCLIANAYLIIKLLFSVQRTTNSLFENNERSTSSKITSMCPSAALCNKVVLILFWYWPLERYATLLYYVCMIETKRASTIHRREAGGGHCELLRLTRGFQIVDNFFSILTKHWIGLLTIWDEDCLSLIKRNVQKALLIYLLCFW